MNKLLGNVILIVMVTLFALGSFSLNAFAERHVGETLLLKNNVTIVINEETVSLKNPILYKRGTLLLPMRAFYELIGADVIWNNKNETAKAIKSGNTVSLTINSITAKLNGKSKKMNVAPLLYKNSVYVPLRFVVESLDGKVIWYKDEQKVAITIDTTPSDENLYLPEPLPDSNIEPYVLHINDMRIEMNEKIISNRNHVYIPVDYFYDNLENADGKFLGKDQYELSIDESRFIFTIGSKDVVVDGEIIKMSKPLFTRDNKLYVPVDVIVENLGGRYRYLRNKKQLYIYLHKSMFNSEFLTKYNGSTPVPQLVPGAVNDGNRSLLVSDNPELLNNKVIPNNHATLAQYIVQSSKLMEEHRIYGWHFNSLGNDVKIAITIENNSSTTPIEIVESKGIVKSSGNSWIDYDIGLPIADAVLNNRLNNSESTGLLLQPGETKIIESYTLHNRYTIGFLQELDIKSVNSRAMDYTIRTVLSKDENDLTQIHSEQIPIDINNLHPRGVWPSSTILTRLPIYTIGSPLVGYNISNGSTDHLHTIINSRSQKNGTVDNPGHFGINYKVILPISNPTSVKQTVKLKFSGRGGKYSGAVKVNGDVYLIPTLELGKEYSELSPITIKPGESSIELEFMHSGGSNLPLGVYIETSE